jgi:predicted ATPase
MLALSYFSQAQGRTVIERIDVDASGRRLAAPEGFFDQSARELLELFEPS